jgi:NAD(P)-dependent dehydrogenase (short-subunit alcohol dehydrogenase family)
VLLLTGACGGIGAAILDRARDAGYRILAVDRRPGPTDTDDPDLRWLRADVTSDADTERVFETLDQGFGRLDAMVFAAGAVGSGRVEAVTPEEFQRLVDLNLTGPFRYARLALPRLRATRGVLVFLSSTNGVTGGSPLSGPAYAAAKGGLITLMRHIARDYGPEGIRANCVTPGPIDTPMLERLSVEVRASLRDAIPLGRIGTPADVADLVAFLLSEKAAYLTGLTVSVSGGLVMD